MTQLIAVFFLVLYSWAIEDCSALLELNQAKSDNRSRLLNGEISEAQYWSYQSELNKKASVLKAEMGHLAATDQRVFKRTNTDLVEEELLPLRVNLKQVVNIQDLEKPIIDYKYDPFRNISILDLNPEALKRNDGGIDGPNKQVTHIFFGSDVSKEPVKYGYGFFKKAIPYARSVFWARTPNLIYLQSDKKSYVYDVTRSEVSMADEWYNPIITGHLKLSPEGSWLYHNMDFHPLVWGKFIALNSTTDPEKVILADKESEEHYRHLSVSPKESYLLKTNHVELGLHPLVVNSQEPFSVDFPEVQMILDAVVNENETHVFVLVHDWMNHEYGLKVFDIEKLRKLSKDKAALRSYIMSSRRILDAGSLSGEYASWDFSESGRYFSYIRTTTNDAVFEIYDINSMEVVYTEKPPESFMGRKLKLRFTEQGDNIVLKNSRTVQVFQIQKEAGRE